MSSPAQLRIFTYREGIASRLGHDLRLLVSEVSIRIEGDKAVVEVPLNSIRVEGALRDGQIVEVGLDAGDKQKIVRSIQKDVLDTRKHPLARFNASVERSGETVTLKGELELKGQRRPLTLELTRQDGDVVGRTEITPSQWGVKPFRALAGALKVQDRVGLEVRVTPQASWA